MLAGVATVVAGEGAAAGAADAGGDCRFDSRAEAWGAVARNTSAATKEISGDALNAGQRGTMLMNAFEYLALRMFDEPFRGGNIHLVGSGVKCPLAKLRGSRGRGFLLARRVA